MMFILGERHVCFGEGKDARAPAGVRSLACCYNSCTGLNDVGAHLPTTVLTRLKCTPESLRVTYESIATLAPIGMEIQKGPRRRYSPEGSNEDPLWDSLVGGF